MDPFHERLARVALAAAGRYGFCLAGGYAVQAHGFVDRVSKDVDLFTTMASVDDFAIAQAEVVAALRHDRLVVTVEQEGPTFARLAVADPAGGQASTIELGVDWRAYPPVQLTVGPVLHPVDAAANKLCALFGRAAVRDYIDVHGVLEDGRFSGPELLLMAADHDPGFTPEMFAEALRAVRRFPARRSRRTSSPQSRSRRCAPACWHGRTRSMPEPPELFTVGHGSRPAEALIAVLRDAGVKLLVDVRRFPGSRRHPQFGREALAKSLEDIRYEWWGETLGGRRNRVTRSRHTALREPAFAGYADHMDTDEFRSAVDALLALRTTPAIVCAEAVWWHCHRMLIADALTMRGAVVVHLLDVGRQQPHRLHRTVRRGEDGWPVYEVSDALPGL